MKKSITIFVVCVAFFVQVNQSAAKVPAIQDVLKDPTYDPLSETARKLVATILEHIQYMLRNKNASEAMVTVALNTEKVLTSQNGQNNIMAILDLFGFLLKDPNASKIISIWCDKADTLITTEEGRAFLRSMILSFHRVLATSNVIPAATALMDGIETYLKSLEPKQIVKGMKIMQKYIVSSDDVTASESYVQTRDIQDAFDHNYRQTFQQNFKPLSPK